MTDYKGLNDMVHALERVAIQLNKSDVTIANAWDESELPHEWQRMRHVATVNHITRAIQELIPYAAVYERWLDTFGGLEDVERMVLEHEAELRAERRAGSEALKRIIREPYVFPGGYPTYLITTDSACICKDCARKEFKTLMRSTLQRAGDGWQVDAIDVNYESELYCDHCSADIESAYGHEESA